MQEFHGSWKDGRLGTVGWADALLRELEHLEDFSCVLNKPGATKLTQPPLLSSGCPTLHTPLLSLQVDFMTGMPECFHMLYSAMTYHALNAHGGGATVALPAATGPSTHTVIYK